MAHESDGEWDEATPRGEHQCPVRLLERHLRLPIAVAGAGAGRVADRELHIGRVARAPVICYARYIRDIDGEE